MDRKAAWQTVQEFVKAPGLQKHMLAVEAAMRWYSWGLAGLLHDFDWEIHPTLEQHPADGAPILRERGLDEDIVRTILSHNTEGTGVERETARDYALLACDEITGLISAAALIRPSKDVRDVPLKSVRKRWKQRAFAAGVDREQVQEGRVGFDFSRECFGGELELWQHAGNVLAAMQGIAAELELDGRLAR